LNLSGDESLEGLIAAEHLGFNCDDELENDLKEEKVETL
jgi:hypothetical protein